MTYKSLDFAGTGGSNQKVTLASAVTPGVPMTLSYWIKLNSPAGDYNPIIVFYGFGGFYWFVRGTRRIDYYNFTDYVTDPVTNAVWLHMASSFSSTGGGSGTLNHYVAGSVDPNSPYASVTGPTAGFDAWGADSGGEAYKGKLADIRLFNVEKTALQIAALAAGFDDTTNLIHHWAMTEGSGITVADSVGVIDGTINNTAGVLDQGVTWSTDIPAALASSAAVGAYAAAQRDYVSK
jgi:hypothetical protein